MACSCKGGTKYTVTYTDANGQTQSVTKNTLVEAQALARRVHGSYRAG